MVINVESSHCYGNFDRFIAQVSKVLKKGGHFCMSDFRTLEEKAGLEESLQKHGLKIVKSHDITKNVLYALKLDNQRKLDLINNSVNILLRSLFKKFSGVEGSRIHQEFKDGSLLYLAYLLQKQ